MNGWKDCSSFVAYCVKRVTGKTISPDSHVQATFGQSVANDDIQAGDILLYDTQGGREVRHGNAVSHVAIAVGEQRAVSAMNPVMGVIEHPIFSEYFAPLYKGARRLIPTGEPPPDPEPEWTPTIYDLRRDYARFGLNKGQADLILAKCGPGRQGKRPELIVPHIQDGYTNGSLSHWLGVSASSTVMIQRDGSILRVIPETAAPWTNGIKSMEAGRPDAIARAFMAQFGFDLNQVSLTIENEGFPGTDFTEAQWAATIWQVRDWMRRYPWITIARIIAHLNIDTVQRPHCGLYVPELIKRLKQGGTAPPPPPKPKYEGLPIPEAVFERLFLNPAVPPDPAGLFTRYLIATERWLPVHDLIRDGKVSYLVTGGGLLKAENGKVIEL